MLRFFDGFNGVQAKSTGSATWSPRWTAFGGSGSPITIETSSPRYTGGSYVHCAGQAGFARTFSGETRDEWVVGFAYRYYNLPPSGITTVVLELINTGAALTQVALRIRDTGKLMLGRSTLASPLHVSAESADPLPQGEWVYIEVRVKCADSIPTGGAIVRVNGVEWINVAAGADTKPSTSTAIDQITFGHKYGSAYSTQDFTDVYICDRTGDRNNDFLGDSRVEVLTPMADTAQAGWNTYGTATGYDAIDDSDQDGNLTYLYADTPPAASFFGLTDLASNPLTIHGIQVIGTINGSPDANRVITPIIRTDGVTTQALGSYPPPSSSGSVYTSPSSIAETNPQTGSPWTKADLESLEAGVRLDV